MVEKKVMVFGTFDLFHEGHKYFLNEAKKHGSLYVIVARDKRVEALKGILPHDNEHERLANLKDYGIENVFLGHETDVFYHIKMINPAIICLGYDQTYFVDKLMKDFSFIQIVRLVAFNQEVYKSSIIRTKVCKIHRDTF